MNAELKKNLLGEFIGTFIWVFFGCGTVIGAVALHAYSGVMQVALGWGMALALAIYIGGNLGGGHYNPAVTLAMAAYRKFPCCKVLPYILTQVVGAFVAACILYVVFGSAITAFEAKNGITRGESGSEASAMVFGEYFPNPLGKPLDAESASLVSHGAAFFAEVIGTAILIFVIFSVTDSKNSPVLPSFAPVIIGATFVLLIAIFGHLTMGCFNPARDFGPRLFSALYGWKGIPFSVNGLGWLTVYIVAPVLGALFGGRVYTLLVKRAHESV